MEAIRNIEFFSFEDEVWYRTADGEQKKLTENDPVVRTMFDYLSEFYPDALAKLEEKHGKSKANIVYYRYRVVRSFCRCNFGSIDNIPDVDTSNQVHFEHVPCPLRGECPMEGVVCHPRFNTKISTAEMRVLELIFRQVPIDRIADRLCLSIHTVKNHKRNAYNRIGAHKDSEFITYANIHNLFNIE